MAGEILVSDAGLQMVRVSLNSGADHLMGGNILISGAEFFCGREYSDLCS